MTRDPMLGDSRFQRRAVVCRRIDVSKSKVYNMVRAGEFPPPVRIGKLAMWLASDVDEWIRRKARGGSSK